MKLAKYFIIILRSSPPYNKITFSIMNIDYKFYPVLWRGFRFLSHVRIAHQRRRFAWSESIQCLKIRNRICRIWMTFSWFIAMTQLQLEGEGLHAAESPVDIFGQKRDYFGSRCFTQSKISMSHSAVTAFRDFRNV